MAKYKITPEEIQEYLGVAILNHIINNDVTFGMILDTQDSWLEETLGWLTGEKYLKIDIEEAVYAPTEKGRDVLRRFSAPYAEYLQLFNIFCAVDLNSGEFAYKKFFEMEEGEFIEYLNLDRWEDLGVAVAEYKKMDPVRIVFMAFLNEERFDKLPDENWPSEMITGEIWDEIIDVCNSNLSWTQLGYTAEDGTKVTAKQVIEAVIINGFTMATEIIKKEQEEIDAEEEELAAAEEDHKESPVDGGEEEYFEYEYYIEPPIVTIEVCDYYITDPFYVSDVWIEPIYIY